jgi:hypothetical protein
MVTRVVSGHHHAERISHQQEGHPGFVQHFCHGKIVSRERGDRFAFSFHGADRFDGDFFTLHV